MQSESSALETEVSRSPGAHAEPVTVVFARYVKPGGEATYEAWLQETQATARGFPGYLGVSTVRPAPGAARKHYVSLVRFASLSALQAWEASPAQQAALAKVPLAVVEGGADVRRLQGFESWFEPPGTPPAAAPPPWKMALVIFSVVMVLVNVLAPLSRVLLPEGPQLARTLVMVIAQVGLMTWVVMPRLTRVLAPWLFKGAVVSRNPRP